jgi:phenylacetate-CoA ligase
MNVRKFAYFTLLTLRGQALGAHYKRYLREYRDGIPHDTTRKLLVQLLDHCKQSAPYYGEVMQRIGDSYREDPEEYLKRFPILSKDIIRSRFDVLKSVDLPRRKWYLNTSGGSTGEPVQFIQDWDYAARAGAVTLLFSKLVGREIGQREVLLWGSLRDIARGTESWRARPINSLTREHLLSVFRLTPTIMREHIKVLNTKTPKLIVSYAAAMYEVASFAEQEGLKVVPQSAIMTSAGTLYPFMREKIEKVFQCRVFDRYGSREVGDIACERPGYEGLWVAPWGNYIEIVDSEGNRVPEGTEGEILVTSLTNYAMPFVRYRVGDRGALFPGKKGGGNGEGQILAALLGRTYDLFVNRKGVRIEAGHFMPLLYFRDWISKYQVIQKSLSCIVFRIVRSGSDYSQADLDEISEKARLIMDDDCEVVFEFINEIPASDSGKYHYIISEVEAR